MTVARSSNTISPDASSGIDAIRTVVAAIEAACHAKDAAAIARHYAPGAMIADVAPPLRRRGFDVSARQAWLDGWDGPLEVTRHDLKIKVAIDLDLCHGLQHTRALRRAGSLMCRITVARPRADGLANHARAQLGSFPCGRELPRRDRPRALRAKGENHDER